MAVKKDFDENKAVELYNKGMGWRGIARELSSEDNIIHPYSVSSFFKSIGLPPHNKVGGKRVWDIEKAKELREQKYTYKQIAQKLGVSVSAVQKVLS